MALVLNDRVKETTTTTGTGTVNLAGAETGFETFVAGIGNSNTTYYAIVHQTADEFEVGLGTVTDASPDTLARTTVISSSNSDSAVNFSAGTKDVFCTLPASKAVHEDANGRVGLGTSSPTETLELGDGSTTNRIKIDSATKAHFFGYDGSDDAIQLASQSFIKFQSGGSFLERMRIDSSGNVGIGTTNGDVTNDGTAARTYVSIIGSGDRGVLNIGSTASAGADGGKLTFVNGTNSIAEIYSDTDSGSQTSGLLAFTTSNTERMRITSTGNVGIGTTSPSVALGVTGAIIASDNITAYGSPSDIRLKENIEVIDNAVDKVKQLKGITYDLKSDGNRLTGLIAQYLEKVLPEAVYETSAVDDANDKHLAIRYGNTVGLLVEAIKEQQEQIETLTARVKELEDK